MKKLMNRLGIMMIFVTLVIIPPVFGSQLHMIPLEKEIENVSVVLQIKVINVDREQTYMKLETGQDGPMVSSSILVTGYVVEVLWGEYSLAKIKTKYIWIVPIKYDKQGKEVLSFSPIRSGSGFENDIEVGSEYIFSFRYIDKDKTIQYHVRSDTLNKKDAILKLLKDIKSDASPTKRMQAVRNQISSESLSEEFISSQEWRLFSFIFPALPTDGYHISLTSNGEVGTNNLSGIERWSLTKTRKLELMSKDGHVEYSFKWHKHKCCFVGYPTNSSGQPPFIIAPAGSTIHSVEENLNK